MILDTASLNIVEMRHLRYQIDEYFNFEFRKEFWPSTSTGNF